VGDALVTRRLGKFRLKGFDTTVEVFELVGGRDVEEPTRAWRHSFEQAVACYERGDFEFARMGFNRTLELKPEDGPSRFYLTRLEHHDRPVRGEVDGRNAGVLRNDGTLGAHQVSCP
jgi:hypothetical protein